MSLTLGSNVVKPTQMKEVKIMAEVEPDGADDGKKEYDEWELDDACRTLQRAEEIKADADMMKALQPHLEKKAKAYMSLAQIKQKASSVKATK